MTPMKPVPTKKDLLVLLWNLYSKQKRHVAEAGIDTFEDIEKMRGWFRTVMDWKADSSQWNRLFPEHYPEVDTAMCSLCRDEGMYFSERVPMRRKGPKGHFIVAVPGMIVCTCAKGRAKKAYCDPKKEQRPKKEEF